MKLTLMIQRNSKEEKKKTTLHTRVITVIYKNIQALNEQINVSRNTLIHLLNMSCISIEYSAESSGGLA